MNKIRTTLLAISAMAVLSTEAQTQVTTFTPGIVAEGVNYALPQTALKLQVLTTTTTYVPGDYCRYADRYLHLKNIRQSEQTISKIETMALSHFGVPDTTKYYTIKLKDKSIAPFVQLSEEGLLLAINTSNEQDEPMPLAVPKPKKNTVNPEEYLTEEILSANSTAKMAELVAAEIYDIRESRNLIMKGQVETMPKDGPSLKIVLDELDKHETALMQLFTGYEETKSELKTFTYIPTSDVDKHILFRFSEKLGIVDADDFAGTPYYISVANLHTVPMPSAEEDKKEKEKSFFKIGKKKKESNKLSGVIYNIPSKAQVKIFTNTNVIFDSQIAFGQFGATEVLSSTLFNKGATTKVTLDSTTGALVSIEQ